MLPDDVIVPELTTRRDGRALGIAGRSTVANAAFGASVEVPAAATGVAVKLSASTAAAAAAVLTPPSWNVRAPAPPPTPPPPPSPLPTASSASASAAAAAAVALALALAFAATACPPDIIWRTCDPDMVVSAAFAVALNILATAVSAFVDFVLLDAEGSGSLGLEGKGPEAYGLWEASLGADEEFPLLLSLMVAELAPPPWNVRASAPPRPLPPPPTPPPTPPGMAAAEEALACFTESGTTTGAPSRTVADVLWKVIFEGGLPRSSRRSSENVWPSIHLLAAVAAGNEAGSGSDGKGAPPAPLEFAEFGALPKGVEFPDGRLNSAEQLALPGASSDGAPPESCPGIRMTSQGVSFASPIDTALMPLMSSCCADCCVYSELDKNDEPLPLSSRLRADLSSPAM